MRAYKGMIQDLDGAHWHGREERSSGFNKELLPRTVP